MTLYSNNQPIDPIELGGADGGDRIIAWFETMNPINKSILSSSNVAPLSIVSNTSILQHATRENLGIATSDSPNFGGVTITADNYVKLSLLDQDLLTTSNVVFNDIEFDSLALGVTVPQSYTKFYSPNSVLFESTRYTQTGHDIGPSVLSSNGVSYILSGSIGIGNKNPTKEFDVTGNSAIDSIYERNQRVYSPSNNPTSSDINLDNILNVDHVSNTGGTFTGNVEFSSDLNWGSDENDYIGLGGGFDIINISYDSVSFTPNETAGDFNNPRDIEFNNDGSKMYVTGNLNDTIYQYSLSTPFDLSTASYDSVSFLMTQDNNPSSIKFNSDGSKMYILSNDELYQYSLSTPFDLSTVSYDSVSFSMRNQDTNIRGFEFNNDGSKMYAVGYDNDNVYQYILSTPFNLSTVSYDSSFDISSEVFTVISIRFNDDGSKMYLIDGADNFIYQYILYTPFDVTTASYNSLHNSEGLGASINFNNDGSKMYVINIDDDTIYQYSIETYLQYK